MLPELIVKLLSSKSILVAMWNPSLCWSQGGDGDFSKVREFTIIEAYIYILLFYALKTNPFIFRCIIPKRVTS